MKPMNRMEAFLMGDKKLAPETRQEAVAQYVGSKLGGAKERILLFKNLRFTKNEFSHSFSDIDGVTEVIDSLNVRDGDYLRLLDKYKMVFYVNITGNEVYGGLGKFFKCEIEALSDYSNDTSNYYCAHIAEPPESGSSNVLILKINQAYQDITVNGIMSDNYYYVFVTCYLEEL